MESKALKDRWNPASARAIADQVGTAAPSFDRKRFLRQATEGLDNLEMKGRVHQFAAALRDGLPDPSGEAFGCLTRSLPAPMLDTTSTGAGWLQWPLGEFTALYGPGDDPASSLGPAMDFMTELTRRFTSEFAVRPFVRDVPELVFPRMLELTAHACPHVRRWCSEGVRPRLPWGERLASLCGDPSPILPILEALKDDPDEYVRRSVANCLGDIAKDHLEVAIEVARGWLADPGTDRTRLASHALRAPIKAGRPAALALFGYESAEYIEVTLSLQNPSITIGETGTFQAEIRRAHPKKMSGGTPSRLMIELVIEYLKSNGSRSGKVFKWAQRELPGSGTLRLTKSLPFVPRSTRRLYPGEHRAAVQVNGQRLGHIRFDLSTP